MSQRTRAHKEHALNTITTNQQKINNYDFMVLRNT